MIAAEKLYSMLMQIVSFPSFCPVTINHKHFPCSLVAFVSWEGFVNHTLVELHCFSLLNLIYPVSCLEYLCLSHAGNF